MCEHDMVAGPFYIMVARTFEEPTYFPPSSLIRAQPCTKCGVVRIPDELKGQDGDHLTKT